jgi:uncharacterized protein
MTIDAHMHVGDFGRFRVSLMPAEVPALFDHNELEAGILFCPDNKLTLEAVESCPAAFGLYWADPKQPSCVEEAERYLAHPKFKGIKLHPLLGGFHPDDPAVHPLVELLIARDMPALIHSGHAIFSHVSCIEELVERYPEAKIILGHMGHGNIVEIERAVRAASRYPSVYLETSGMPMPNWIAEGMRAAPERVLFGSDAPFHPIAVERLKVELSGLDNDGVRAVLHDNAQRLFFERKG